MYDIFLTYRRGGKVIKCHLIYLVNETLLKMNLDLELDFFYFFAKAKYLCNLVNKID